MRGEISYRAERARAPRADGRRFVEVHARASVEECARHDAQGLYDNALRGEIEGLTGVSHPYEAPIAPEVLLETQVESPDESARNVLAFIERALNQRRVRASVG